MKNYVGDLLVLIGCILILIGIYLVSPIATLFVGGSMFIGAGVLVELGRRSVK